MPRGKVFHPCPRHCADISRAVAIINVPEVLRKKLNEDGTEAFVGILNQVEQSAKENSIGIVSERFERRLSEDIAKVELRISAETNRLDNRISEEANRLDNRISAVDKHISESHVSTIRWMFAFWTVQTATIVGLFLHLK